LNDCSELSFSSGSFRERSLTDLPELSEGFEITAGGVFDVIQADARNFSRGYDPRNLKLNQYRIFAVDFSSVSGDKYNNSFKPIL
jgi:hypothetical protein